MARFRLSLPAQADLARILETSAERWGTEGRRPYAATLAAAMRALVSDPASPLTHDRSDLLRGIRSFHIRHARSEGPSNKAKAPVHVVYYRAIKPGLIEIVRVLHERMEPSRHIEENQERSRTEPDRGSK